MAIVPIKPPRASGRILAKYIQKAFQRVAVVFRGRTKTPKEDPALGLPAKGLL